MLRSYLDDLVAPLPERSESAPARPKTRRSGAERTGGLGDLGGLGDGRAQSADAAAQVAAAEAAAADLQARLQTSMYMERVLQDYVRASSAGPASSTASSVSRAPADRPRTAPSRSWARPLTGTTRPRRPASGTSRLYNERPHVSTVVALRNGETNPAAGVQVSAPGLRRLLEECTRKLQLPFAARYIFDVNGEPIRTDVDLAMVARNCVVYVSTGEAFRRPAAQTFSPASTPDKTLWTVSGLVPESALAPQPAVPEVDSKPEGGIKALVFKNGSGDDGRWIVGQALPAFLDAATARLGLPAPAVKVFGLDGEPADVANLPLAPPELWPLIGRAAAPLVCNSGETEY